MTVLAGKIRAIAISADTRWSARPTVPTISETLPGEQPGRLAEGRGSLGNRETLLEAVQAVS